MIDSSWGPGGWLWDSWIREGWGVRVGQSDLQHLPSAPDLYLPGIFMLLLIFFAFLHCWLNAFAEMLRFGDRMFYRVGPGPGTLGRWMQEGLGQAVGRMVAMPAVTLLPNQVHLPNMQ